MRFFDNLEKFMCYTQYEMEEYIKEVFQLRDNYLIGRVLPSYAKKTGVKSFRIENLRNPITGNLLNHFLIDASPLRQARSNEKKLEHFEFKTIIFQFEIKKELLSKERVETGDFLRVKSNSAVLVEDYGDIFKEMDIDVKDLTFPVTVEIPTGRANYKVFSISDFYQNLLQKKIYRYVG